MRNQIKFDVRVLNAVTFSVLLLRVRIRLLDVIVEQYRCLANVAAPIVGELKAGEVVVAVAHLILSRISAKVLIAISADAHRCQNLSVRIDSDRNSEKAERQLIQRTVFLDVVMQLMKRHARLHR